MFSCNERNDVELNKVKDDLCNITFTDEMIVNSHDIMTSISSLCRGKVYDSDNLSSEHFIHAKQSVILPLCIFFSALLVHGYLPNLDSRWVGPDRVRNSKIATETVKYADSHQSLLVERGGMTHT